MQKKKIPIGVSDFKTIITENGYYVDKSMFISDVVDNLSPVLLFARPRRFGKTLNLSLLSYFYDNQEDNAHLFTNLKIAEKTEIMKKQGKHPVIYMTFKDVKQDTWKDCLRNMQDIILYLTESFNFILSCDRVSNSDKELFQRILSRTADKTDYEISLKRLLQALYHYYQVKPVILIDEYDTPIHEGYFNGYYKEIIGFMRVFLGSALKDDKCLEKAVLTGILRVSRESLFSGLNNLKVCSISVPYAGDKFGFTEDEVKELLAYYDDVFSLTEVKRWYDGYNFGEVEIYNPWAILNCINDKDLSCHWVNTAAHDLLKELCLKADASVKHDLEVLTQGGYVQKQIDDNIVFAEIDNNPDALWSFLLHCGYLRYDNMVQGSNAMVKIADLSIPNYEVAGVFIEKIVKKWFTPPEKTPELMAFINNLIIGDVEVFRQEFIQFCHGSLSYFDVGGDEPESAYHMLVLGMISCLQERYHIVSNREAGFGRSDVMIIPIENPQTSRGVIIEFKKVDKTKNETFDKALEKAKRQIEDKKYIWELQAHRCKEIVSIAVAFEGKDVRVEVV